MTASCCIISPTAAITSGGISEEELAIGSAHRQVGCRIRGKQRERADTDAAVRDNTWLRQHGARSGRTDAIVCLGHDSAKRAAPAATPVSLIIHTSVPYGIRLIKEGARQEAAALAAGGRHADPMRWVAW